MPIARDERNMAYPLCFYCRPSLKRGPSLICAACVQNPLDPFMVAAPCLVSDLGVLGVATGSDIVHFAIRGHAQSSALPASTVDAADLERLISNMNRLRTDMVTSHVRLELAVSQMVILGSRMEGVMADMARLMPAYAAAAPKDQEQDAFSSLSGSGKSWTKTSWHAGSSADPNAVCYTDSVDGLHLNV
jgi:hypothetical protein